MLLGETANGAVYDTDHVTFFQVLLYFLFFFIGIEYVLILPSLNGYLELLGVGSSWLGVCIGSLNFAALITNIPCGLLVDHTGNVRLVATALALCCGLGNILYVCIRSIEAVVASSQVPKLIDSLVY